VLANADDAMSVDQVCRRIQEQTGLRAVTGKEFEGLTIWYFMEKTGIPFNFGITVLLGFIVGTAIAAQTIYLFTIENIKQYGALKAMGAGNWMLMSMILLQAMLVSITGFGLGMGGATWFGTIANAPGSRLAFYMPLEVFVGTGLAVMAIGMLSSLLSMQRVMVVEPAVVFQG
jgi:putative ABC transport system permease protein